MVIKYTYLIYFIYSKNLTKKERVLVLGALLWKIYSFTLG